MIALASAWFLVACGAQGPPQPPRVEKPERVTDLAVAQVGRALVVSFTPPALATDGDELSKAVDYELFRHVGPVKPAIDVLSERPWLTLTASGASKHTQGGKLIYSDTLPEQEFVERKGQSFSYWARALTHGFRGRPTLSEPSNTVSVTLLDVSPPVEGLQGETTEHSIDLHWTAPERSLTGGPLSNLAGYRLYKSKTGKPGSFERVAETAAPAYQDHDFAFDTTYFYKVRAVFKQADQVAESDDSKPFATTPHDVFPPATPAGLTGLYTAGAVELIWTANTEPDLAGYNVYRRDDTVPPPDRAAAPPQKLNQEFLATPIFRDTSAERGHRYQYWVTAVDLAKNESPLSAGVLVETQ
jgi:fibronectin type 3 domain-containing protein